ncbi:MAG: hypothetical protein JWM27_2136 [Gemmatimonadetes bacterium]|nr:hypothetical protein [Gemmatimonadota bacterium]
MQTATQAPPRNGAGTPGAPASDPPVMYRGAALRAPKRFLAGTHRYASPEETLERIRPHLRTAGITRLADVTGLDRISIHTVIAQRPNAKSLSNSAGKGFSLAAATVSAAMEGIEIYHAEEMRLPRLRAPYDDLHLHGAAIPLDDLPLARRPLFSRARDEAWVRGWDLLGQEEVLVPEALVAMAPLPEQRPALSVPFPMGSNGLASGNHFLEAACAALLEVVERDAVACHVMAQRRGWFFPRVRLETVEHPLVRDLVERLARSQVQLLLYDATVDTAVPVYVAYIYDRESRHSGMYKGYGAHLDPETAMIRAVTEAVQSRVVYIAGSRDDYFRHDALLHRLGDDRGTVESLERYPPEVDARERASRATGSFEGDIAVLLGDLRGAGIRQAILLDLQHEEIGIPVVRAIVPGMEGYMFQHYQPGRRAAAFTEAHAGAR